MIDTIQQEIESPLFKAGMDMIRRTGAKSVEIRYSDDPEPVVWMVIAQYATPADAWDAGAGQTPLRAMMRLLDQLVDGGFCVHCGRPTGITEEWRGGMPFAEAFCWYRFDPELGKFRRGCE